MINDDALWHEGRAVALVERQIRALAADGIAEERGIPLEFTNLGARIRIEHELVRIEAMSGFGRVRPMHAIPVHLAGAYVGNIAVPDFIAVFG